jgi:hypothetical protein
MESRASVIERAFQLAATDRFDNVTQIKRHLHSEGYTTLQVSGPTLFKQLMAEISYAHDAAPAARRASGE